MKKNRILIVDDKEENRYLLQTLLQGHDYEVITAVHGADALDKARLAPPDMIIADILMPVMDGFALCRKWKKDERLKNIPFIFYTATYTDERDRKFALGLGANQFIIKPEEPASFMAIIQDTLLSAKNSAGTADDLPVKAFEEESAYLKQYNEVLIHKLEEKMEQLEKANNELSLDNALLKVAQADIQRLNEQLEKKVAERTAELQEAITRLEELNRIFVGREMKMAELKARIAQLEKQ